MEDSPLSITASVTGILTFIAAIFAFIYVRYNTLRNGRKEMSTILESVSATIEETRIMTQTTTQPGDHPESNQLKKLVTDLYSHETEILSEYARAYGVELSTLLPNSYPQESRPWDEVVQEIKTAKDRWQYSRKISKNVISVSKMVRGIRDSLAFTETLPGIDPSSQYSSLVWGGLNFVLTLGETPSLIRWYMVRDKVLEKIHQREILRSRLLFHQMSHVNLQVTSQEILIRRLMNETVELRSILEDMSGSTKRMIEENAEIKSILLYRTDSVNEPSSQPELRHQAQDED